MMSETPSVDPATPRVPRGQTVELPTHGPRPRRTLSILGIRRRRRVQGPGTAGRPSESPGTSGRRTGPPPEPKLLRPARVRPPAARPPTPALDAERLI